MEHNVILPAEWYPQSAVQLTWPHENTDWAPILDEVIPASRYRQGSDQAREVIDCLSGRDRRT